MPDIRLLTYMADPITILGHSYWVDWNVERQVAEVRRDGRVIADFPFELAAHQYILELASLDQTKDMEAWQKINEQTTIT